MHRPNATNPPNAGNYGNHNRGNRRRNNNPANRPNDNFQGPQANRNTNRPPQRQHNRGRGNNHRPQTRDQHSTRYFNFTRLNDLSQKDSNDVVAILDGKKAEFEELLHNVTTPDVLVVTLRVLTNVCRADFAEIVISVLAHACSKNFLKNLEVYLLTKLPFESPVEKMANKLYHEDRDRFWSNLIEFFRKVIELIPSKARDELTVILQKINMISATIEMNQKYKIDEKVKNDALEMYKELEEEIHKVEEKNKVHRTVPKVLDVEENPPEDFRSLGVIPTIQDLYDEKPFIRPCKIQDAYNSVEHYLDVQFRLLREDFVSPLRDGIREYLHGSQKFQNNELRIYRKVNLIAPQVDKNNVGIMAFFGLMKQIKWRHSKRFMYGGLLLLSSDNFNTVLFVTVANRDEKELEKGFILIEPCEGTTITRDMYNINFVMLESKIYFEPYLAVLTAMQNMNEQNFPMENYLVNADTSIRLPRYLTHGDVLRYKGFRLPVRDDQFWPNAKELKLDETQYNAFRCALTQEFAVIQGPPGTGKTFIALEIVRTLLENEQHWIRKGPIVVVCLTNHALDQFLEGILKHTSSIVRVGSRSKSETLKPYTLMERRKFTQSHRRTGAGTVMYETKHELESILSSMEKARLFVKHLTTADAIVPLTCLTEYCYDTALAEIESNEALVNWLIGINVNPLAEGFVPPQQLENLPEIVPEDGLEDDHHRHMDDELELAYKFQVDDSFRPIFPLKSMDALIANLHKQIREYRSAAVEMHALPFDPSLEWEEDLNTLNMQRMSLQRKLAQHPVIYQPRYQPRNPRWKLYWKWVRFSYDNAMNKITQLETTYRQLRSKLNEAKQLVDLTTIREHKIIGLTTAGAAKLQSSLRALHAPIVLVEEAAEILEAHVVCSLTKQCEHAILIGDHKQLRPKASVYQLGKKYNLNISLFERMVNIRGNCSQLAHQHRMRPQIAKLITPSIYDTLYNHESVLNYPNVKGLEKNLFFLNHNNPESKHNNEESWVNKHEAVFLVAFARHLIMQGYNGTEITILCLYTGQLFALMKETARYTVLKQVRVTSVDNYQGEENRIILLSLVRNNGKGNIGFLREENRVCVALSRAREGLYVMGNMDDLVVKNEIWPKIKTVLENENAIGDTLELRCQIHAQETIQIKNVSDFEKCPEGGCLKKCEADLVCGHTCTSTCHTLDREHLEYQCKQPCIHSCPYDHPCPLKCWQGCKPCLVKVERQLKCGHTVTMSCSTDADEFSCYVEVDATLPDCNHSIKKSCGIPIEKCKCSHACENRLPCGHACQWKCHVNTDPEHIQYKCFKDCTKNNIGCMNNHPCKKRCHEECTACPIIVEKTRSCGHYYKKIQCAINVEDVLCERPCRRELSCGHKCKLKCSEICRNCPVKVQKVSSCGHTIEVKCCEEATPSKCSGKCQKKLLCGHPCTAKCKDPCITNCKTMVRQSKPGLCGHVFSVPCHLLQTVPSNSRELLKYCKQPCGIELNCTHICSGKCGQCKQGRIHIPCTEPCGNILICGHKCDVPCREECRPCNKPCELKCRHSKCGKKCGIPCTPCKEMCAWRCEHRKCEKRCSEICDIEPCQVPCQKMLECGHPCVGFCGDPCPPLCRICNNEELTFILFGDEDEPDARFVFLEDCSHCIESNGLMQWVAQTSESIQMKTCPRCKTPIRKCMRIMNQIKKDLKDVLLVKKKVFGNQPQLKKEQAQHLATIQDMFGNPNVKEFREIGILLQNLLERGIPIREQKRQILSSQEVQALRIVLDFLHQMFNMLATIKNRKVQSYQYVKNQVIMLVESLPLRGQISDQELSDINLELERLKYMAELCNIDAQRINDGIARGNPEVYDAVIIKLLSVQKFTKEIESEVRKQMIELHKLKIDIIAERKMIVKAIGLTQGHWYKCPNGHPYAIADCGGAMQESKCIECGATIGGQSHRLASGNSVATEMDGATRPAWPPGNGL